MIRRLAAGLVGLLLPAVAAAQGFSIQQVMSAPFPDGLTAAPSGGAVAWVFSAAGVRNVWVAEAPEYRGRQLTSYTTDEGMDIGELAWSPDSKFLFYTRGTGHNGNGESPNPSGFALGTEQEVFRVALAGGAPVKVGEGRGAAASPAGSMVAWIKGGQIWSGSVSDTGAPVQILKEHGSNGSLRWSPDGSRLAFVSYRGNHSFIGVLAPATSRVTWLDPSVDSDYEPIWSPDGKQIAFIRQVSDPAAVPFAPMRRADPWSIRIADVATGAGHEIWKADTGRGSAYRETDSPRQLIWAQGDKLIFPWEKDGWLHLYAVSTSGGKPTLLTPGAFEVEHVNAGGDGKSTVYSSNQGDIDRRHIWRVSASGGAPAALTSGTGLEWAPVATADGKTVAVLHSNTRKPPRPAIVMGNGTMKDLAPDAIPSSFPETSLVEPAQVIFSAADGMMIHGQLFLPKDLKPGEHRPSVIFFHGGSQRQMLLGWHYMYYYRNAYAFNQYLASRGYIVLSVNYRSGIGYGMEFREAINYGAMGASEYNDVMGAGLYLRGRNDVDPARIGLWGGSYGGYLTALGLARASDLFAAGVDLHGVHDWNNEIGNWVNDYNPGKNDSLARLALNSSPMGSVATWRSPVLLIHGDDDRNVPFTESVVLAGRLRRQGVEVEQLIFPDEVHDFLLEGHWVQAYTAAADFLDRKLAGRK